MPPEEVGLRNPGRSVLFGFIFSHRLGPIKFRDSGDIDSIEALWSGAPLAVNASAVSFVVIVSATPSVCISHPLPTSSLSTSNQKGGSNATTSGQTATTVITPSVTTRSAAAAASGGGSSKTTTTSSAPAGSSQQQQQQQQPETSNLNVSIQTQIIQTHQSRPSQSQDQQQQQQQHHGEHSTIVTQIDTSNVDQQHQRQQQNAVTSEVASNIHDARRPARKPMVPVSGPDINQGALDGIDMSGFGVDVDDLTDSSDSDDGDDSNMMSTSQDLEMQAQLVTAGPAGVAAAAAIASAKKRKRPHTFETNPSVRKRQQTRILRKLRASIDEYTTRVGQQAVVLITMPGKAFHNFKVFGAQPLENVIRSCKHDIMAELEHAIAQQAPQPAKVDSNRHELPPLVIDGIPTPVEKMTQAQLRAFIPLMLKYSTGRGKPGWGKDSTRPPWWPDELPWANVRSDARDDNDKQKISWTHTLRQIVINCYRYHEREDLLPTFLDSENAKQQQDNKFSTAAPKQILHPSLITSNRSTLSNNQNKQPATMFSAPYASNFVQTINNSDGTVSLIQVDPTNAQILTLPDGTQVRAVRLQTIGTEALGGHTLTELTQGQAIELQAASTSLGNELTAQQVTVSDASIGGEGQIIITGEDGSQNSYPMSSLVSIPVSMYQQLASSGQHVSIVTTDGNNSAIQGVMQAIDPSGGQGQNQESDGGSSHNNNNGQQQFSQQQQSDNSQTQKSGIGTTATIFNGETRSS
ncbi:hypothetical protein GZH46_02645 [Fragariocoptes setiger]|uniref:Nuclear respiratory factor 1 NLS/DNA-binding dimerisation domain-containing protein n=1 Tax=Fragariocoptes setiger TaxID=1670756 RepID=A0ABQ7S5Z5_9ACAR|nr:hypothetical protein GZH46_02645 [Fragariocoptes setiger]